MLYLIGIGLDKAGFSFEAYNAVKNSRVVYLEDYTVELPFEKEDIEELIEKKTKPVDREFVESFEVLKEAKEKNVSLLVYGSPLMATTHISLILEAKRRKIPYRIIQGASVFDAVAETGLQVYKFGKTASMPNFEADSFMEIIKENLSIKAHTLILVDIGLKFKDAVERLEKLMTKNKINVEKAVVCEHLGLKDSRTYYNSFSKLRALKIKAPFCFVIPSDLHFLEKEFLEKL